MRQITANIYELDELSEKLQGKIISAWRSDDYFCNSENVEALNSFVSLFFDMGLKIRNYNYGDNKFISFKFVNDYEQEKISGVRLYKWVMKNLDTKAEYGNVLKNINDCPLSGYCIDYDILQPISDFLKKAKQGNIDKNYSLSDLVNNCLSGWINYCHQEYEYWCGEEAIKEEIKDNDKEFYEDGRIYNS